MSQIYRVIVRGLVLESADLRKLMARAVADKRAMDRRFRLFLDRNSPVLATPVDGNRVHPANGTGR